MAPHSAQPSTMHTTGGSGQKSVEDGTATPEIAGGCAGCSSLRLTTS